MANKKKSTLKFDTVQTPENYNDVLLQKAQENDAKKFNQIINSATGRSRKKVAHSIAFSADPQARLNYAGVYQLRRDLLSGEVIKTIRSKSFLIATILRARGNTISMMSHVRKDRFDTGVEINIKKEFVDHIEPEQMVQIQERKNEALKKLMSCGNSDGLPQDKRMTLPEFTYLQVINGLSFGWFATEFIWDTETDENNNIIKRKFHRFRPVDAGSIHKAVRKGEAAEQLRISSIRQLESLDNEKLNPTKMKNGEYAWVQVINGTPKQAFSSDELLMYTLYPSTDIEHSGYPLTPLDTVMTSINTHLSIETYNKLYFQNGRAARGMLIIQADEIDQAAIEDIKQQYAATINNVQNSFHTPIFGVGKEDNVQWVSTQPQKKDGEFEFLFDQVTRNILSAFNMSPDELPGFGHLSRGSNQQSLSECLDLSSKIYTKDGYDSIDNILKDKSEIFTDIWTGDSWVSGRVFKTGPKKLMETIIDGGISIKTSPDHFFRTVNEFGEIDWKTQSKLTPNDCVLLNKNDIENKKQPIPKYNEKELTVEMMEVLGWLTGDGSIVADKHRAGAYLNFFYHHQKEIEIQERHYDILKNFGLSPKIKVVTRSDEERLSIQKRYNFNSVAKERRNTIVYSTDFFKWLKSIGFNSSNEGKVIPQFIYTMPIKYRAAFLRGLFSADGHIDQNDWPYLTISNLQLRQEVVDLLLSLGIRSRNFTGKTKEIFVNRTERATIEGNNKIAIKDKASFFEKIGFIQDHKQAKNINRIQENITKIPQSIQGLFAQKLIDLRSSGVDVNKDDICALKTSKIKCTLERAEKIMSKYGLSIPEWMKQYNFSTVKEVIDHQIEVEMADITIDNKEHAFIANGIVVHNSNNEYKLIAARDTGIRPLILKIQDFFNEKLFPILDPELAQLCNIEFGGFDAETKQQESVRLQQDMPIHYDYDTIMNEVDKKAVGPSMMGEVPFNEHYRTVIDSYLGVNKIISYFGDMPSAEIDPILKYKRDQFWFQYMQMLAEANPAAFAAYFSTPPDAMETLNMLLEDYLEEEDIDEVL